MGRALGPWLGVLWLLGAAAGAQAGTPAAGDKPPIGWFDGEWSQSIAGWALDPNTPDRSISVHVYFDGMAGSCRQPCFMVGATANKPRPDVNKAMNVRGDHGFDVAIPPVLRDGQPHTVRVYGIDSTDEGLNLELSGSPKNVQIGGSREAVGSLDAANGEFIAGWAKDPDFAGPIMVHIYVDGVFARAELANLPRPGAGQHAFHWEHPPFGAGQHMVTVYAIGVNAEGAPDGRNPPLSSSPQALNTGCKGLTRSTLEWCQGNPNYWAQRQKDTVYLANERVRVGVNLSYGGMIAELYSGDWDQNLIHEHGGSAIQLSLWGYDTKGPWAWFGKSKSFCDPTPYKTSQDCRKKHGECKAFAFSEGAHVSNCQAVGTCDDYEAGWPWNPMQARGARCRWDDPANDAALVAKTADRVTIKKERPNHFTKSDVGMPGLAWTQTVTLKDAFVQVDYDIAYAGPYTTDPHPQEIPALFTAEGVTAKYFYYGGYAPFSDPDSPVSMLTRQQMLFLAKIRDANAEMLFLGFPGQSRYPHGEPFDKLTEGWWGVCDQEEKRCLTVATFSPLIAEATLGLIGDTGSGYITPMGGFGLRPGAQHRFTLYLFPYKYDAAVGAKSVRQRIFELARGAGNLGGDDELLVRQAASEQEVNAALKALNCGNPRLRRLRDPQLIACYEKMNLDASPLPCLSKQEYAANYANLRLPILARELAQPKLAKAGFAFTLEGCRTVLDLMKGL